MLIKQPEKIFDFIDTNIGKIEDKINEHSIDKKNYNTKKKILKIIKKFKKEKLKKSIDEFKRLQEWDKLTIAFYGETNAGKSTLIETLRIYFKEKNKLIEQSTFKEEYKKYNPNLNSVPENIINLEDGNIIGNGKSDYTKVCKEYDLEYKDLKFTILDLPGIEGKESKVINEISSALKKAHIIFYVINNKPQQDTLKKIKDHLNEQTEVYIIYNLRVNNPIQLEKNNANEIIEEVNKEMKKIFDKNYMGYRLLSAKPAFLSVATCLIKGSKLYKDKKKFLNKFDENTLLKKSGFYDFGKFITTEVIINAKQKIKKSNFKKANSLLEEFAKLLEELLDKYSNIYEELTKEFERTSETLKKELKFKNKTLNNIVHKIVRKYQFSNRKVIYDYINTNIDDNSLETKLKSITKTSLLIISRDRISIKSKIEDFLYKYFNIIIGSRKNLKDEHTEEEEFRYVEENIPNFSIEIKKEIIDFSKTIKELLKEFKEKVKITIDRFNFDMKDKEYNIKLNLDSGIDTLGLFSSALKAIPLIFATNGFIIFFTISTVLVSIVKSIWNYFDDDYKKSEQKRTANENIDKIALELEETLAKHLDDVKHKLSDKINNIISRLENYIQQYKIINNIIGETLENVNDISYQIKKEGEL